MRDAPAAEPPTVTLLRRMLVLTAILVALFGTRCADGFRQDEMDCEQAMSHLVACCPGFVATGLSCTYDASLGCGGVPAIATVLSVDDSKCILAESCDDLRSSDVCDRAADLPQGGASTSASSVCP